MVVRSVATTPRTAVATMRLVDADFWFHAVLRRIRSPGPLCQDGSRGSPAALSLRSTSTPEWLARQALETAGLDPRRTPAPCRETVLTATSCSPLAARLLQLPAASIA